MKEIFTKDNLIVIMSFIILLVAMFTNNEIVISGVLGIIGGSYGIKKI